MLRRATYLIAAPPPQKHESDPSPAGRIQLTTTSGVAEGGPREGEAGPAGPASSLLSTTGVYTARCVNLTRLLRGCEM
jgi:hypothetical protein